MEENYRFRSPAEDFMDDNPFGSRSTQRTLAEDHVLPILMRVSLDSLVTSDCAGTPTGGRDGGDDFMETLAYF